MRWLSSSESIQFRSFLDSPKGRNFGLGTFENLDEVHVIPQPEWIHGSAPPSSRLLLTLVELNRLNRLRTTSVTAPTTSGKSL